MGEGWSFSSRDAESAVRKAIRAEMAEKTRINEIAHERLRQVGWVA
jgi:hypothetical protein